ncbi:hypothetical protein [Kosakonia radicincitans]|uniref:hypothetical protein n=1 Tax=Kosakonia radicincitans TaxID=283686 RepID=UPI002367ABB4|nr:hypothetical protein [Kosakonia radicincitans]MDD7993782.1 hypothetical protein [Kosakonia radicincitans]
MEWGSIPDLVSACSNIAMAGAAVYAAFNAKRWFSQRSHTKGFDKAEEILVQIDTLFRKTIEGINELHGTLELLGSVSNKTKAADHSFLDKYEELSNQHNHIIKIIDRLSEELELIERWSIEIKNQEIIKTTIKAFRDTHVSASNAYVAARSAVYNLNYLGFDNFEPTYKHFKDIYGDYLSEIATSEYQYSNFKKQKFTNFFKIK